MIAARFSLTLLFLAIGTTVLAADADHQQEPNGISVGAPKVFDNRTLTIMMESLSQTLQSIQAQQFVDQKTLSAALLAIQGSQSAETNTAVNAIGSPTPAITKSIPSGGTALTTNVTQAALTPAPPTLTDIPAFSGFTPNFGASAGDLLNDSVNLNYQIFNLRMLLERALSDRLSGDHERLQTVLGFNISIDPPKTAVDSVAVVEITLSVPKDWVYNVVPEASKLSLVALMPQEKTYNAAALSSKSNAFGGSAVVGTVQVGASARRREQIFYLYRDADTVAYERMTGNDGELVFGWMFRPVLGRRSVSPGLRQLFAVAALPGADCANHAQCPPRKLVASIRTLWKKYDRATLTSFERRDANLATRFRYAASLGLSTPEIFDSRYVNRRDYPPFVVNTTHDYEKDLRPEVVDVRWTPVGAANALITAEGANFFTGTQVILGDKTYGPADGLILKSNGTFQLLVTQDALGAGPAVVSGRYASPVTLVTSKFSEKPGLTLLEPSIEPAIGGKRRITIPITGVDCNGKRVPIGIGDLPDDKHPPLITVNGHSAQQPYPPFDDHLGTVNFVTSFADEFLEKGFAVIRISWPFLLERYSLTRRTTDPALAYSVIRVGDKSIVIKSTTLSGFINRIDDPGSPLTHSQCWQLFAGDKPVTLTTENCPCPPVANSSCTAAKKKVVSKPKGKAKGQESGSDPVVFSAGPNAVAVTMTPIPDRIVLLEPIFKTAFLLDVPKLNADAAPKADSSAGNTVNQFDSVIVPLTVAKANNVASITADLKSLTFAPRSDKPDETVVNLQVTRDLSSKPGNVDLTIVDKQGKSTNSRIVINRITTTTTKKSEGK